MHSPITISIILILIVVIIAILVLGRVKDNNFLLTYIVAIDGKVRSIHSDGYRTAKLAFEKREALINELTTNDSGENIYYTAITGRDKDPERILSIREVSHIFKIQELKR
tara:strand:- start:679 stop:1008 length:330 start_codon:yes stop_codon:yes gene_type:complete